MNRNRTESSVFAHPASEALGEATRALARAVKALNAARAARAPEAEIQMLQTYWQSCFDAHIAALAAYKAAQERGEI